MDRNEYLAQLKAERETILLDHASWELTYLNWLIQSIESGKEVI